MSNFVEQEKFGLIAPWVQKHEILRPNELVKDKIQDKFLESWDKRRAGIKLSNFWSRCEIYKPVHRADAYELN